KRAQWEDTWTKQRAEDAITARLTAQGLTGDALKQALHTAIKAEIGAIPVPPKYTSADFLKSTYWKLRGKLDVPKERWVSYPGAERAVDQTLVLGWAGWDQLQQAKAIAAHYERLKSDGAPEPQLARVLASLDQLIPWLLQWHNALDPEFQLKMGDYFRTFIEDEAPRLHLTAEDLTRVAAAR
ncbi:MAG: SAM-dependent methyltransferase, partial [Verrucomicrobia bacterium]|nr:SAM-dependent methyltransferase [Verrucomicrobiota bacterium]